MYQVDLFVGILSHQPFCTVMCNCVAYCEYFITTLRRIQSLLNTEQLRNFSTFHKSQSFDHNLSRDALTLQHNILQNSSKRTRGSREKQKKRQKLFCSMHSHETHICKMTNMHRNITIYPYASHPKYRTSKKAQLSEEIIQARTSVFLNDDPLSLYTHMFL